MERDYTQEERYLKAKKRIKKEKGFYGHLFWYVVVNAFLLIRVYMNLSAGESFFEYHHFTTLFFWGIGLFIHWIGVFGNNLIFSKNWEKRKMDEFMDKEKRWNDL